MRPMIIAMGAFLSLMLGGCAWAETGPYFDFVPRGYHVSPDGSTGSAGPVYDSKGYYAGYYRPRPAPAAIQEVRYDAPAEEPQYPSRSSHFFDASSDTSGINWDWTLGGAPPGGSSGF